MVYSKALYKSFKIIKIMEKSAKNLVFIFNENDMKYDISSNLVHLYMNAGIINEENQFEIIGIHHYNNPLITSDYSYYNNNYFNKMAALIFEKIVATNGIGNEDTHVIAGLPSRTRDSSREWYFTRDQELSLLQAAVADKIFFEEWISSLTLLRGRRIRPLRKSWIDEECRAKTSNITDQTLQLWEKHFRDSNRNRLNPARMDRDILTIHAICDLLTRDRFNNDRMDGELNRQLSKLGPLNRNRISIDLFDSELFNCDIFNRDRSNCDSGIDVFFNRLPKLKYKKSDKLQISEMEFRYFQTPTESQIQNFQGRDGSKYFESFEYKNTGFPDSSRISKPLSLYIQNIQFEFLDDDQIELIGGRFTFYGSGVESRYQRVDPPPYELPPPYGAQEFENFTSGSREYHQNAQNILE